MNELTIDARCLASGIGTYGYNVLNGLAKTRLRESMRVITTSRLQDSLRHVCDDVVVSDAPIYSLREQLNLPRIAHTGSVFHAFHYNAPVFHRGPLLVTIHDLTHILDERCRHDWRSWAYARPMLRTVARRADHIVTVSNYVRQCIIEHLHVPELKVTVSHCGVGHEFSPGDVSLACKTVQSLTGSASPYLLFVGNLKPHKNLRNLLLAFAHLVTNRSFGYRLVVIGDDARHGSTLKSLIEELGVASNVQLIAQVTTPELIAFYRAADLLVLPSFQEGFGLPVVEAMACGTPVVCSRAASLPEVGGDAAQYFDPHDPEDIANTILEVLGSDEKRKRMSELGRAQARTFTWGRTVGEHLRVYEAFLPGSSAAAAD